MPALHVLYMQGNPATQKIAGIWGSYRKYLLARLPALTFLNDRPVHKNEQRCSAAWFEGGLESETLERSRIHHEMENANNNSSITNRARIQETVLRRREEIRARRIAMGVDPQVPAFNPRGRMSESTPQSEHPVCSADDCPSDNQASMAAEGEDAGGGDGCKVRYYRLPDGSLLRQTDFTPHDRALAARSSAPAPHVPGEAAAAGAVGSDYPPAAAGEGGVRQGLQLESGIETFDPTLTPSQRFALHKAKQEEEEDRLAADAAHSGAGSAAINSWENRYCSASSAFQQRRSTTSSSCVATSSFAAASAPVAAAAAAAGTLFDAAAAAAAAAADVKGAAAVASAAAAATSSDASATATDAAHDNGSWCDAVDDVTSAAPLKSESAAAAAAARVRVRERETEREATAAAPHGGLQAGCGEGEGRGQGGGGSGWWGAHGGSLVGCGNAGARRSTGVSALAPATRSVWRAAALGIGPSRPLLNLAALTPEQVSERA